MKIISKKEWASKSNDQKSIIDGQKYVLALENGGTCLVPVELSEDDVIQDLQKE